LEKFQVDIESHGFGHPECYAQALGGCCREISDEHYISKSVLELVYGRAGAVNKTVLVTGLAFQKRHELREIGVSRLVGRVLCKKHNEQLSPYDRAGKAMFAGMDGLNDAAGNPAMPDRVLHVDGDGLERWMLKALCGGLYSGAFLVTPTETMKGVCPPFEWLEILFGGALFPPCLGLYYMAGKPAELITSNQYVLRIEPLGSSDGPLVGGIRVWYFGFEFDFLMGQLLHGVPTMFDNAVYRPEGLTAVGSNTRIRIDWRGGSSRGEVVVMHANR
jgi:hypothetical protein